MSHEALLLCCAVVLDALPSDIDRSQVECKCICPTVSFPGLVQGKLPLGKATDTRIFRLGGQKLTMWLCPFSVDTPKSNS